MALRLAAFARRAFADFGLRGADTPVTGVGLSMEDFIWRVLEEYVEGRLVHDASRGDLFPFLATALRNDIIDALRRAAHVREESRSPLPRDPDSPTDPPSLDELPSSEADILQRLDEETYLKRVWASLAGEPELTEVVRIILDHNLHKPREIARAAESEARTFRKSAGTLCDAPGEIPFLVMDFILHRFCRGTTSGTAIRCAESFPFYGLGPVHLPACPDT